MSGKPTAQGTLAKTPFAHLLLYAHDRGLTGTLAIWPEQEAARGRGQDRLFLQGGQVVAVRALERHKSAFDAVLSLFARLSGAYGFYADQNLLGSSEEVLHGAVDLYAVLARGLRLHARDAIIDSVLMRIGGKSFRLREGVPLDRLELGAAERKVVERLQRSKASIDELLRDSGLSGHDVRRLVYLLTLIRGIEMAESHAAIAGLTVDTIPPGPKHDSVPTEPPVSEPPAKAAPASPLRPSTANPFGNAAPSTGLTALTPAPPVPPGLSPEHVTRWQEIAGLHDRLDELTHYQLLQVPQSATPADINAAYFALIKKLHPDRLPAALAPLARCAQQLFDRLTEANHTLGNAETRAQYDQAVQDGGGTRAAERKMRDVLESALEFQKAEVLMKRRDYAQAMQYLRSALNRNPEEGDYHALHGWLLHLMNPSDPAPTDQMLAALDRALRANGQNERAHYYRGVVLKRLKRDAEALHHFRTAANLNPRNVDAVRELRLASMRRESKPPPPGLLSKLFKGSKEGP